MSRFAVSSLLLSCLLAPTIVGAQVVDPSKPVFTAPMVHPIGSPELMPEPPAAGPAPRVLAKGEAGYVSPHAYALEVAEIFRQACVVHRADDTAAVDWAMNKGFVPSPTPADLPMGADGRPETASAYMLKSHDADSVLLVVGRQPARCVVISMQRIDGRRLRSRVANFAANWVGEAQPPQPIVSRAAKDGQHSLVAYDVGRAPRRELLSVLSPQAEGGPPSAFLMLQIDDATTAAR